jgi:hypothetical protein
MPSQESTPDYTRPVTIRVQAYVDPAVLQPGRTVTLVTDPDVPLEVLRVEPHLIVRTPDGRELNVPAHAVEVQP